MKKHYKNGWVKALFAVLFVFGLGATFYIFSNEYNQDSSLIINKDKQDISKFSEQELAQKDLLDSLNILKLAYDVAILEKTALSQQLELERKNIENLTEIIKASKRSTILILILMLLLENQKAVFK